MNRAFPMLLFAAALLAGCGPAAPTAKAPKVDPTTEGWYAQNTERLTNMDRAAQKLLEAGRKDEAAAIVTYTTSGSTTLRAARERPKVPILCLTSKLETARRLTLSFGVHAVHTTDVNNFSEMVQKAVQIVLADGIAPVGQRVVITAGVPFGTPGNTNVLRIAWIEEQTDPRQLSLVD